MKSIQGVITAMVTSFTADGAVDVNGMRAAVRHQITSGAAGLCPLGGTGEPLSMTVDEHKEVIDAVMAEASGLIPVVIGTLLGSQDDIITVACHAKAAGADAIMVIPPYFVVANPTHIHRHFETIAEKVDMPMMLFHGPTRSNVRLTAETILELVTSIPQFFSIKETSGDLTIVGELLRVAPAGFRVLQGFDELLLPTFALGGHGGVVSLGHLIPNLLRRMYEAFKTGDLATARHIQLQILPICGPIYGEPNPGPLKVALQIAGRSAGPTRQPIYQVSDVTRAALERLLPALLQAEEEASGHARVAA